LDQTRCDRASLHQVEALPTKDRRTALRGDLETHGHPAQLHLTAQIPSSLYESKFNLLAAPLFCAPLRNSNLSSRLKPIMSFGGLLSSLLRLHVHTHSLTTLAYFFMQELLFAYHKNCSSPTRIMFEQRHSSGSVGHPLVPAATIVSCSKRLWTPLSSRTQWFFAKWKKASGYRSEPRTRSSQGRVTVIHHF
jgi:hypothetical protein